MLRNEYIQQKDKGTKCMELFILMSCAEFLGLCLDRKSIYKSLTKKKRCSKQEIIEAVAEEHVCMWVCVCIYVCMYVCMYKKISLYIYLYM